MNLGALLLLMFVLISGVACVFVIAAGVPQTPFVDSNNNTTGQRANVSQQVVANGTAPVVGTVGGAIVILLVVVLVCMIAIGLVAVTRKGGMSNTRSRYQ